MYDPNERRIIEQAWIEAKRNEGKLIPSYSDAYCTRYVMCISPYKLSIVDVIYTGWEVMIFEYDGAQLVREIEPIRIDSKGMFIGWTREQLEDWIEIESD